MSYILAADIGGTKIRLGLFSREQEALQVIKEDVLPSKRFGSFDELLEYFLEGKSAEVGAACLGVAGPIKGDTVRLTNLPWVIDGRKMKRHFGFNAVSLINDLQATAFSIPHLADQDIEELSPGEGGSDGCLAVIAPGTGLGMAFIARQEGRRLVAPSEGGHCSFAPATPLEMELLGFCRQQWGQVSYEDLCSGGGFFRIYRFLQKRGDYRESEVVASSLRAGGDPAPLIVDAALSRKEQCPLCRATVELFSLILAEACSRLALTVLATGGVYIAGGISPRILPFLRNESFLQRFRENRKMGHLLNDVPVKIILNHRAPLMGAAARALEGVLSQSIPGQVR